MWSCCRPQGIWHVRSPNQAVDLGLPFSVCVPAQLCPSLCNLMDCNPPGSSVHGIFQARILEWVSISYSRESSQPRDQARVSCISCICMLILYHCTTWEGPLECVGEHLAHRIFLIQGVATSLLVLWCPQPWPPWPCCPHGASSSEGVQVWITSLHLSHCSSAWCWVCPVGPGTLGFLAVRWQWWWWWWYMLCLPHGLVVKVSCICATFINCKLLFETWASVNKINRASSVSFFPQFCCSSWSFSQDLETA